MTALLAMCLLVPMAGSLSIGMNYETPPKYPVAVSVKYPHYKYKQIVHSIKGVDFKNFEYRLFGTCIHLHNGFSDKNECIHEADSMGVFKVSLDQVWYFDIQRGQPQHALVSLDFFEAVGSSSDTGIILL